MKQILFILFFLIINFSAFTQTDTAHTRGIIQDTASSGRLDSNKRNQVEVRRAEKPLTTDTAIEHVIADTLKTDSAEKVDSLTLGFLDSTKLSRAAGPGNNVRPVITKKPIDSIYLRLLNNPFITRGKPVYLIVHERERDYKDEVFYLVCGLLLFLAFIKLVFSKYFRNIFRLFFQPAFRQKQTREQLAQSNLPSLLLNLFFIFSSGIYISFLLKYYHHTDIRFWWLLLYTNASLLTLYIGKYIFLSFAGWVFDAKQATEAYIFAVYLINKIVGVILIPFTLLIAFSEPAVISISITICLLMVLLLFIYRYLVSYPAVRRELNVGILHFFFFICAFEIMPLLLIYKTLIIFLNNSH